MTSRENQIEKFKQMVRNAITARLRVLETTENNISELKAAESETERILGCQVLQMLEEHSVENEAWVDAFSTARNQSPSSDTDLDDSDIKEEDDQEAMDTTQSGAAPNADSGVSASKDEIKDEAQESLDNLRGQILREMLPIILELSDELGNYYGRIRESLEEIYPELPAVLASLESIRCNTGNYIISLLDCQVIEQELLRKYLEVETAINHQNN